MELIITEKDNAARRIADILSGGTYDSSRENGVNVYEWGGKRCVGLSGHVVGVDFPSEYSDWRDVEPVELIDASIEKTATKENIVATLRILSRKATRVTIATDYDREGELIGKEAYDIVREVDEEVPIRRVRFSSITENEVQDAFDEPDELDFDLAAAGEARQIIDLVWGAALTRFLSLSAGQLGNDFISVGRVQSPTLKLMVDREREIEAFDPEDYWELVADVAKGSEAQRASETSSGDEPRESEAFEAQYFYRDEDGNEAERVWEEAVAEDVFETLSQRDTATVVDVNRRTRTDSPPAPFNTTQFIRAASALGYSAKRAMSIAEDLYTAGYITYPRTDNTVYPDDLDPEELLDDFVGHPTLGESAESLLEADEIEPTEGDEETTDHPPIHPTGEIPSRGDVSDDEWEVFELVVRRFYATVAEAAIWEHLKVVAEVAAHRLKANGKRLDKAGYHDVYPYFSTTENYVPDVSEGEEITITDVELEDKQTQPPRRYGQSRLIETMEDMGIGTKSTRHETIQKLYDRGYIESDPPRPTKLAMAVVEAAENYADRVVSEDMTAQLEQDMDAIASGEAGLEDVTNESREMLEEIFANLADSRDEIGDHLRKSLKDDKRLGPCPECGEDLLVRRSRHGSYFIGCDGYPDCENTLPLPSTGKPLILDEECEKHDLNEVKMLAGRQTFVHGCPLCKAEDAGEGPVLGDCPECGDEHGGELAVKTLQSGSRLVGCTRYPDCEYSLPLPRRGEIEVTEEYCGEHDLPELVIHSGDEPWELGCPICNYQEFQARESESGSDLESLDGVGAKTVEKLAAAGIESLADLTEADPDSIAEDVDGVSADRIRNWQASA
ncbi:DNA topoisomerase 1 [Natrialba magadii ATCC 43099]|uniref:DNA topoisomerase 1 n=1 Tax=Natrialba magadii (strain ATCC 43099 / DSM 3394 / CCM 3739 / CIP 104546 / IAM 13178 / JCM 8861 / NBRC 102185 / NCIMB 2190 / MS3) TaxID=547559 RepID=D3SY50_NATMM|nr:DNA topoisomerase I [Natrialba magadii]ADD06021.1 DNA topoisomerase 1 [Natrialba magadii ATCC 43099]ELY30470.1 DNA topoisomerase I [Natrialba magadii ATCC 43099]